MKTFWLYFGIFLACSGIGTILGIIIIIMYFWNDIKKSTLDRQSENHVLENSKYFDEETAEKMK
ncbi:MAG: hypothetical protein ACKVN8_07165 [Nitrosarchaeum sp.]